MTMAEGFLTRSIARVRLFVDDQGTNAKYSNAHILDLLQSTYSTIVQDLNRNTQGPIIIRHAITFAAGQDFYVLPPSVGSVVRLAKVNSTTGAVEWEATPRSRFNPCGPGFTFEGNIIRVEPFWTGSSETLQLEYVTNGDVVLHEGTAGTITNGTTSATIVLAATPTLGLLDTRPNAYAGSVLRVLSASTNNYVQERIIQSYDVVTRAVTLKPQFTAALLPGGATVTYEIAPLLFQSLDIAHALSVAKDIVGIEGDGKRYGFLTNMLRDKLRTLRLGAANFEQIVGLRFQRDARSGVNYLGW